MKFILKRCTSFTKLHSNQTKKVLMNFSFYSGIGDPTHKLFLCLCVCPFLSVSVCPFLSVSVCPFLSVSVCPFLSVSVYLFHSLYHFIMALPLSLSLSLAVSLVANYKYMFALRLADIFIKSHARSYSFCILGVPKKGGLHLSYRVSFRKQVFFHTGCSPKKEGL